MLSSYTTERPMMSISIVSCVCCLQALRLIASHAGGAVYLFFMSRKLATAVAGVTALLWIVALRYGNFSRQAQRTYQDALAETNQVRFPELLGRCVCLFLLCTLPRA